MLLRDAFHCIEYAIILINHIGKELFPIFVLIDDINVLYIYIYIYIVFDVEDENINLCVSYSILTTTFPLINLDAMYSTLFQVYITGSKIDEKPTAVS